MASLMKKLFDTMPLNGVEGALRNVAGDLKQATVGQLSAHLQFLEILPTFAVTSQRPPSAKPPANETPIWSYKVLGEPNRVREIGCRVRAEGFNELLVLDKLEWGVASIDDPTSFRSTVRVVLDGVSIELPLVEDFRLMSFMALEGENAGFGHTLWPLDAKYDPSLLHVFVYDLMPASGELMSLKSPEHPDREEIDELVSQLRRLTGSRTDDEEESAEDFLLRDDLWGASYIGASPTGTVPEHVELSFRPIRVVVACSLTVCREKDDYQPGRPAGVGRLYPHVMVVSTVKLDQVDAGVRFSRPKVMTLLDGARCSCDEMLPEIGGLLTTDSNANAMVVDNNSIPGILTAPHVYHANLFNYYVVDPFADPELQNRAIPIVSRSKSKFRDAFGLVERDCSDIDSARIDSNSSRVTKFPRQAWFDNIHLAPKMVVKDQIDRVSLRSGMIGGNQPFSSKADWRMESVVMAPFCAHDCFHMHWRWSNNANNESHTYGWGSNLPYQEVGKVMIPENQDAFLVLTSGTQFSYIAQAHGAPADVWQPFCHHGAGYGLSTGTQIALAKVATMSFSRVLFERRNSTFILLDPYTEVWGDWALFYWRNRFTFVDLGHGASPRLVVKERFSFKDKRRALEL